MFFNIFSKQIDKIVPEFDAQIWEIKMKKKKKIGPPSFPVLW